MSKTVAGAPGGSKHGTSPPRPVIRPRIKPLTTAPTPPKNEAPYALRLLPPLWAIVGEYMSPAERSMVSYDGLRELGDVETLELHSLIIDGHLNVLKWLAAMPPASTDAFDEGSTIKGAEPTSVRWRRALSGEYAELALSENKYKEPWNAQPQYMTHRKIQRKKTETPVSYWPYSWKPQCCTQLSIFTVGLSVPSTSRIAREWDKRYSQPTGGPTVLKRKIGPAFAPIQRSLVMIAAMCERPEIVKWLKSVLPMPS